MINETYKKEINYLFISFLIGIVVTALICPYLLFHPTDVNYLNLDKADHFFGWAFYRQDIWHWPLTFTNHLIYPTGVSIVFTDSFPIFSILLKSISAVLPKIFIFHGMIMVLNFSLMFYFSNLLLRKITHDYLFSFIGSIMFVLATPLLARIQGHIALSSHWIIVAGLIPLVDNTPNDIYSKKYLLFMMTLLFLSFGIHAYLASMLLILLFAYIVQMIIDKSIGIKQLLLILMLIFFIVIFSMYLFGYFINPTTGDTDGFGYYCANLLSFVNPQFVNSQSTSLFFPSIDIPKGQSGGYAYLGLGIFLMAPFVLYHLLRNGPYSMRRMPLYVVCIACFLFSLSNHIYLGNKLLVQFGFNCDLFQIFRASQRYIWVAYYAILVFAILSLYRVVSVRKTRILLILVMLMCQIVDIFPLITLLHNKYIPQQYAYDEHLDKTFWFSLGEKYMHMDIDPVYINQLNNDPYGNAHLYKLAYIAIMNNMTINNFYLARRSVYSDQIIQKTYENFLNGILDKDTIYIMDEQTIKKRNNSVNLKQCRIVDSYYVCSISL